VPARVVPPLPQRLASGDLPVGEQHPSREAPVQEGLAVLPLVPHVPALPEGLELPEEVVSFSTSLSLLDTKRPNKLQQEKKIRHSYIYSIHSRKKVRIHMLVIG